MSPIMVVVGTCSAGICMMPSSFAFKQFIYSLYFRFENGLFTSFFTDISLFECMHTFFFKCGNQKILKRIVTIVQRKKLYVSYNLRGRFTKVDQYLCGYVEGAADVFKKGRA